MDVTVPLSITTGSEHSAAEQDRCELCIYNMNAKLCFMLIYIFSVNLYIYPGLIHVLA